MQEEGTHEEKHKAVCKQEALMGERRSSIQLILKHPTLTNEQRRHSIQVLMDGKRRSSFGSTYLEAAKNVAAEFASSMSCASNGSSTSSTTYQDQDNHYSNVLSAEETSADDNNRYLRHQNSNQLFSSSNDNGVMLAFTLNGEPAGNPKQMVQNVPHCAHYKRNCSIISPCCGMVFGCRLCHDECVTLPIPFMNRFRKEEITSSNHIPRTLQNHSQKFNLAREHHDINRFDIKEVICNNCFTRQTSKSNKCINCDIQFGEYHCNICNLWMNNTEEPYHCSHCGICRVGGEHNFKHCQRCGICIDKSSFNHHICQDGKYMSKCPVCYEDLFLSRSACHELPCGHSMHSHCFFELSRVDIRCPICKKTMIDEEDKMHVWQGLKEDIDTQPLPADQAKVVNIVCNDCEIPSTNRRWHPLGTNCLECGSFNTSVDIKMSGVEAHAFLHQLELGQHESNR